MNTDNSVTFKNLDLYGRSWFGLVQSAGTYNFDNINYHGSQMVYSTRKSTINYYGNVNAETVTSYTLNGKTYYAEGASSSTPNKQQLIEFRGGNATKGSSVNFKAGSNVTLTSVNGNVIQLTSGAAVNVENGATVNLDPHSANNGGEGFQGRVAHGIYANGGTISVANGGKLIINTEKGTNDYAVSGGIYLANSSEIDIADGGNLTINSNGQLSNNAGANALYIDGTATVNVGSNATFDTNASNLGDYSGSLVTFSGKGTVSLNPQSNFKIIGDGTGKATAITLAMVVYLLQLNQNHSQLVCLVVRLLLKVVQFNLIVLRPQNLVNQLVKLMLPMIRTELLLLTR